MIWIEIPFQNLVVHLLAVLVKGLVCNTSHSDVHQNCPYGSRLVQNETKAFCRRVCRCTLNQRWFLSFWHFMQKVEIIEKVKNMYT